MIHDALPRIAFRTSLSLLVLALWFEPPAAAQGIVRHKTPDRGTYQPPVLGNQGLQPVNVESLAGTAAPPKAGNLVAAPLDESAEPPAAPTVDPDSQSSRQALPAPVVLADNQSESAIRQVSYESEPIVQPCSCESCQSGAVLHEINAPIPHTPMTFGPPSFDGGCDAAPCDEASCCDGSGCDALGCNVASRFGLCREDWFGSVELLLMFRQGDHLPALATDGPLDSTGGSSPQIFAGREKAFEDVTAGGRLTIGAWLDNYKDRHVVGRAWFAGEQTFGFNGDQNSHPTLVRPFFNVTDGVTPADDILVVATPDQASGQLTIQGDSNVYGADLSIRQLWYKRYGATIDLLYGYQYMGLDESLTISDRSTSLAEVPPIGSVRATTDQFDLENDFHGGQIGVATHYREGCWSVSSLAKIGFGSIRRRSTLAGSTLTSIDGNNATDANGLLVRSTNTGTRNDNTFGWAPELDLTLGWQRYPCFDVTVGYHLMAMTDALRLSGALDPNLAVNAASPAVGAQRPSPNFRHGTFYIQGIHFGLSYIY